MVLMTVIRGICLNIGCIRAFPLFYEHRDYLL
jgi:hypothetical protein